MYYTTLLLVVVNGVLCAVDVCPADTVMLTRVETDGLESAGWQWPSFLFVAHSKLSNLFLFSDHPCRP